MKRVFSFPAFAAIILLSMASFPSGAFAAKNDCGVSRGGVVVMCDRAIKNAVAKIRPKKESESLMSYLKAVGFPGAVEVTSRRDYRIAVKGWEVRKHCSLNAGEMSHDMRLNVAKVVYCNMKKAGYSIPKPEIVKAW